MGGREGGRGEGMEVKDGAKVGGGRCMKEKGI